MKDEAIHEEKFNDALTIKIFPDDTGGNSPEDWGDDALFLVGYHRDFTVHGPKVFHKLPEGTKRDPADKGHLLVTLELCRAIMRGGKYEDGSRHEEAKEFLALYHIFGLEAYIHSGVVLALSYEGNFCDRQWDVSQLGLVFVSKKEWKTKIKARQAALGLIGTWNDYLSGNVYGYVIEDPEGKHLDSCWGFSGDYDKNCLPEARSAAAFAWKEYQAALKSTALYLV